MLPPDGVLKVQVRSDAPGKKAYRFGKRKIPTGFGEPPKKPVRLPRKGISGRMGLTHPPPQPRGRVFSIINQRPLP